MMFLINKLMNLFYFYVFLNLNLLFIVKNIEIFKFIILFNLIFLKFTFVKITNFNQLIFFIFLFHKLFWIEIYIN